MNRNRKKMRADNDKIKEVESAKENIFANSIVCEIVCLTKKYRAIPISIPSESTLQFLRSPDFAKELLRSQIEILNKILLHLP